MIKFKYKDKNDTITIMDASEVMNKLAFNKEQKFLKEGYKVVEYLNDKINKAISNNEETCFISEIDMKRLLLSQENTINNYALYIHDLLLLLKDKYGYDYEYSHGNLDRIYLYFQKIKLR